MNLKLFVWTLAVCSTTLSERVVVRANPTSQLDISVRDRSGESLPCRIHLKNRQGVAQKFGAQPFWHDHFVCSGRVTAPLAPGKYDYAIERGPEYLRATGQVEVTAGVTRKLRVKLERIADLRSAGWFSGDLHVHRPVEDIEQLMRAEDLDLAPVITWWNNRIMWKDKSLPKLVERRFDGHRVYTVMAGKDERVDVLPLRADEESELILEQPSSFHRQFQELVRLTAQPGRLGNSSLRSV